MMVKVNKILRFLLERSPPTGMIGTRLGPATAGPAHWQWPPASPPGAAAGASAAAYAGDPAPAGAPPRLGSLPVQRRPQTEATALSGRQPPSPRHSACQGRGLRQPWQPQMLAAA
jgi:hypothetical protein